MKLREVAVAKWRVLAVCSDRGDCQLLKFLGTHMAGSSEGVRMMARLRCIAVSGPSGNSEASRTLGDHVFEMRTKSLRVLYFYDEGQVIVCSHGFVKKTQKCPPGERAMATTQRQRYLLAKKRGELVIVDE